MEHAEGSRDQPFASPDDELVGFGDDEIRLSAGKELQGVGAEAPLNLHVQAGLCIEPL